MFLSILASNVNRVSSVPMLLVAVEGSKTSHERTPA